MRDRISELLDGQIGAFCLLPGNEVPALDDYDFSEGYITLEDNRISVQTIVNPSDDSWPDGPSLPSSIVGATGSGAVLVMQVAPGASRHAWGTGQISVHGFRSRLLVADSRILGLRSTLVNAVEVTFLGTAVADWAGLEATNSEVRTDPDGRVKEVDLHLRSVPNKRSRLDRRSAIELQADWRSSEKQDWGFDVEVGLTTRIETSRPSDVDPVIDQLHRIQDLISLAFGGYVRASRGAASFDWESEKLGNDAQMWHASLMPDTSRPPVRLGNTKQFPAFKLEHLGGAAGLSRWIRLYDRYPRALALVSNSLRIPRSAPEAQLLETAAAIDYWVNSHKGTVWRKRGSNQTEALALRLGRPFGDWIGDIGSWASEFRDFTNDLKHDPKFDPDPTIAQALADSGRLLLVAALLDRAGSSKRPSKSLLNHFHHRQLGDWFQRRYGGGSR